MRLASSAKPARRRPGVLASALAPLALMAAASCAPYTRGEALRTEAVPAGRAPTVVWSADAGRGIDVAPRAAHGALWVGTTDRRFQRWDGQTGRRDWRKRLNGSLAGGPHILGLIGFAATEWPDGAVYGLDLVKKKPRWRVTVGEPVSEAVYFEGAVLVATAEGQVYGLAPADGKSIWVTTVGTRVWGRAHFDSTHALMLVPGRNGRLYAVDARSGEQRWVCDVGKPLDSVTSTGDVFVVSAADSTLTGVDPKSGNRLWIAPIGFPIGGGPVADGPRIVVVGRDGSVGAVDAATGAPRWRIDLGGPFVAPPATDGVSVVLASTSGLVWRLDAETGRVLGEFRHPEPVRVAPVSLGGLWVVAGERGRIIGCRWEEGG
jgi:outer membrane protein assembly factor BamB